MDQLDGFIHQTRVGAVKNQGQPPGEAGIGWGERFRRAPIFFLFRADPTVAQTVTPFDQGYRRQQGFPVIGGGIDGSLCVCPFPNGSRNLPPGGTERQRTEEFGEVRGWHHGDKVSADPQRKAELRVILGNTRDQMKIPFCLSLLIFPVILSAQTSLDGLWEGTMTVGGIYSDQALPMQLYITTDGTKIQGRSYVTLPDGEVLRMDLSGHLYGDRSLQLMEINFAGDENNDIMPEFNRQYQIVFKPDLWDSQLRGFWQEVSEETFSDTRRRGRMVLRKNKGERA